MNLKFRLKGKNLTIFKPLKLEIMQPLPSMRSYRIIQFGLKTRMIVGC